MGNFLMGETSPYLLQHAENPVNWYPWCEEAFRKAAEEDKPVFLSIGYSTCHWCHVMAHESFEDEEVAKILNESFISIKVDKEERPDIDSCGEAERYPAGHAMFLIALSDYVNPPAKVTVAVDTPEDLEGISLQIPLGTAVTVAVADEDYPRMQGQPTYYVCKERSCHPPVTELKLR